MKKWGVGWRSEGVRQPVHPAIEKISMPLHDCLFMTCRNPGIFMINRSREHAKFPDLIIIVTTLRWNSTATGWSGKTSGHLKSVTTFPWIENCLC